MSRRSAIRTSRWYPFERAAMHLLIFVFLRSRRRFTVEGAQNLPRSGPVIVLCNHIATLDPPVVGALLPRLDVHYMAKSEVFSTRRNRFLLRGYNSFPVVRQSADRAALDHALEVLREGHVLVIFPEGSRSTDATLGRAFAGVGFLARRSRARVLPAAIWGSENVLPKGSFWPRPAQVRIRFGQPVSLETLAHGARLRNRQATDLLMGEVAALLPERYRGVYDGRDLSAANTPSEPSHAA